MTNARVNYTPVTNNNLLAFGDNVLYRNDDSYSDAIDITSIFENGITIGSTTYTSIYVNNNGNVTFGSPLSTYTPGVIGGSTGSYIIAPFWGDVDTREDVPATNDGVFWDFNEARDSIVVTWHDVGYFSHHTDRLNDFQLELRDRGAGNVEIIFRYNGVQWTTGDASGGSNGLGGTVARAGFSLGDTYFELPASGNQGSVLALEDTVGNLGVAGVWQFLLQGGDPTGFGSVRGDRFVGTAQRDVWFGLAGNDTASGRAGNDALYGNGGRDLLRGEGGLDRLYGDAGNDTLDGGTGNDLLNGGSGNDRLIGGLGIDRAEYSGNARITVNLNQSGPQNTGQGLDVLIGIEHVSGGGGNDRLTGNNGRNALTGNAGADVLTGNGGADTLLGGAGADVLMGGAGVDQLIGGAGNDRLLGGAGGDRFVFTRGAGTDRVIGYQDGLDRFVISSGAERFADVRVVDVGSDVRVSFANVSILVTNTAHTAIGASDFIFT